MNAQAITLHLPQDIFQRLQHMADATCQPLEEIVFQTIRGNLPPSVDDLPPELRDVLASMQNLSDEALWAIVKEPFPPDQWRRHEHLLYKNQAGTLTDVERAELTRLRTAADHFMFRRSYALALLKWRGYTLFESLSSSSSSEGASKTLDALTSKNSDRRSPASS